MGLEVGPEVGVEAARRTGEYIVIVIYCYSLFIVNWSECRRFSVVAFFYILGIDWVKFQSPSHCVIDWLI